jgi:hypothetical protein
MCNPNGFPDLGGTRCTAVSCPPGYGTISLNCVKCNQPNCNLIFPRFYFWFKLGVRCDLDINTCDAYGCAPGYYGIEL